MKKFGSIGSFRKIDIRVYYNDNIIYEGNSDELSDNLMGLQYSKVEMGVPVSLYVYEDNE